MEGMLLSLSVFIGEPTFCWLYCSCQTGSMSQKMHVLPSLKLQVFSFFILRLG